jgi:putative ABC transport system permease protein
MTAVRYIAASLVQYWRVHWAVAAGVTVATAVITGALLVGDSVRGSLSDLVLERLGRIEGAVVAEQPFREELADDIGWDWPQQEEIKEAIPLLIVPGSISFQSSDGTRNATQLSIIGVTDDFWTFGDSDAPKSISGDEAFLSRAIANELDAKVDDEVLVRVAVLSNIPADSTLGEKTDSTRARRLKVSSLVDRGIARFSLQPSQTEPRNVFVPLATLQRMLELPDKANAIVVLESPNHSPSLGNQLDWALYSIQQIFTGPAPNAELLEELRNVDWGALEGRVSQMHPKLIDYGLNLDKFTVGGVEYEQLSAERLVLNELLVDVYMYRDPEGRQPQAVVTYLANSINLGDKKIPYSTVTGIDSTVELGPLHDENGEPILLSNEEIVLNDWAADQLGAKVGDTITLKYYEPETTHGKLIERTTEPLTVRLIAPLKDAEGNLTSVADEHFTPELPGVTDEASISDWELPFPLVEKISQADEDYWDEYRTTPKAFVSLSLAEKLWSSRWGTISALRWPAKDASDAEVSTDEMEMDSMDLREQMEQGINPFVYGFKLLPLKEQGLAAARGTTPFEGLFLGFSFFLMASAVMLIALLFRLGAESRAKEVGLLTALGWPTKKIRRLWLAEAGVVAAIGAVVGAILGIAYAWVMIYGLTTWWVDAITTPFLSLHVNPTSLVTGFAIGVAVSLAAIWWSLRKLVRLEPRQLLAGDTSDPRDVGLSAKPFAKANLRQAMWLPAFLVLVAIGVGGLAIFSDLQNEAQAGAFFGSGFLVLTALVLWLRGKLRQPTNTAPTTLSLTGLAIRNARRAPSRTLLSISLAAVASFLIVALSAFRLAPTDGGTGGFDLIATSDLPVFYDLNTPEGREELGFSAAEEKIFSYVEVRSFRVQNGEDASCLNLYQTTQPRVIGVPDSFYDEKTFGWANHIPLLPKEGLGEDSSASEDGLPSLSSQPPPHSINMQGPPQSTGEGDLNTPWQLLNENLGGAIPVVLDKSTAMYSLHLSGVGSQFTIRDAFDNEVTLEVVGLLTGSVLQGNVLMSEANFLKLFPDAAGNKLFLIRNHSKLSNDRLASMLETRLTDQGFDAVDARARLAEFMAVQNTYLSTFQSLGALGLLLGTVGLAVAQLRSVVERRGELALLRSAGFRQSRLAEMVLSENVSLLFAGLGIGCVAALVATLPHWVLQQADIPWGTLAVLLAVVAVCGVLAGWLAVRAAVRAPLVAALRGE